MSAISDPGETGGAPIDLDHLRRITFMDAALERELLSLFSARASVTLMEIEQAGSEGERSKAAHRLVGAARAIGANRLADAAQAIELGPKLSADNVEALSDAMDSVVTFLEKRLGSAAEREAFEPHQAASAG